ncbi:MULTISPECIES: ABC transporter substrate-binding protein [unclassified Sinorhizobium]|uniref:ABC transporter substrate-binding protein n=1 Tax=unclassified Sinorhizobium TaxID=2613772 RepID=UPI0035269DD7
MFGLGFLFGASTIHGSWCCRLASIVVLYAARCMLILASLAPIFFAAPAVNAQAVTFTDIAGRQVDLPRPARRIVLADGQLITALSLLEPDPTEQVVGWAENLLRYDPATYDQYRQRFPAIEDIPRVGGTTADTFSVEKALSLEPDLVIIPLWFGVSSSLETQLSAAGVAVAYLDFFNDPLKNTVPSIRMLGKAIGREERAEAYVDFYESHMQRIADRLTAASVAPSRVFLHARAGGWECCWSAGGRVGEFIEFAGGENIAKPVVRGMTGQVSLEYVLSQNPDVYIAAGGADLPGSGGFAIGPGAPQATVQSALEGTRNEPGIGSLGAFASGRAHALWLFFFHSPTNVVAAEVMAKWFHPDLFADLDPQRTLAEINRRFLAVPMDGTYWADLESPAGDAKAQ